MDVTVDNFDTLLPEIEASIEKCSFMAIDCELSGLKINDDKDNCFETIEERYQSVRKSASEFIVLQFGLVNFFYDEEKGLFTHKAYNFYTFPRQAGRYAPNIRFLCESSSIEFLCSCGFDFNKLFYKGVPYLTYSGESKMREDFEKRQSSLIAEEGSTPIPVPEYLRKFMDDAETKVKRFVSSKLQEYSFENLNPFQRKLIFNNIKPKYGNKLYFETVIPNEAESETADSATISESDKSDSESTPAGAVSIIGGGKEMKGSKKKKNGGVRDKVLRVVKVSEDELVALNEDKKQKVLESIEKAIGFAKVIRLISKSGKIVVGHNMLLDVSHTISQFVDELPNNLADFKNITLSSFPNVIDTKLMASTHPFRELIMSTVLLDLMKRVQQEPFKLPKIIKSSDEGSVGYNFNDEKLHEAGFDAFITGVCFIGMSQHLGQLQSPKKPIVLPESPIVMPFINKIYLMRMLDITYLNISGTDLTPSRSHVFYVRCPKDAVTKNVQEMFSPYGPVQIYWQTETSLFVALSDKDQAPLVMRTVECDSGFQVIPFEDYQKIIGEKKRPLGKDSSERLPEKLKVIPKSSEVGKSSPPSTGQKKKRPKTESTVAKPVTPQELMFEQPASWD